MFDTTKFQYKRSTLDTPLNFVAMQVKSRCNFYQCVSVLRHITLKILVWSVFPFPLDIYPISSENDGIGMIGMAGRQRRSIDAA